MFSRRPLVLKPPRIVFGALPHVDARHFCAANLVPLQMVLKVPQIQVSREGGVLPLPPTRVEVQAQVAGQSALSDAKIMAEVNFSYPRVLIGRQPNSHINSRFFHGRTSKPAAEPPQRAVPSPARSASVRSPPARRERHSVWREPLATANTLFSHVSKAIF